jgi:penicillin-binding protein-related factor A (putative recombinase)|tara:strand:- start:140 stop:415 length:276 start_codon:yes stop_codon:yes gene_type:complete
MKPHLERSLHHYCTRKLAKETIEDYKQVNRNHVLCFLLVHFDDTSEKYYTFYTITLVKVNKRCGRRCTLIHPCCTAESISLQVEVLFFANK